MKKQIVTPQTAPLLRVDRLRYDELAHELRVQPCTVRSWTRQGAPYVPAGRLKFFDLAEVMAWLRARDQAKKEKKEQMAA